MDKFVIDT